MPNKKYDIIYADCPWQYDDKALAGNRGAGCKYDVQSVDWLKSLRVKEIASDNSALFFWVTMPQLNNAIEVMNAWGFAFKTNAFTWVKMNKVATDTLFWGMGRWTRSNAELCLLGTRGKPQRESAGVHSVIMSPIGAHSEKPQEARDRIIQLCGDKPRIELFSRNRVDGWDAWGNQVDSDNIDILPLEL